MEFLTVLIVVVGTYFLSRFLIRKSKDYYVVDNFVVSGVTYGRVRIEAVRGLTLTACVRRYMRIHGIPDPGGDWRMKQTGDVRFEKRWF